VAAGGWRWGVLAGVLPRCRRIMPFKIPIRPFHSGLTPGMRCTLQHVGSLPLFAFHSASIRRNLAVRTRMTFSAKNGVSCTMK
jgi:hypothetical protein